MVIGLSESGGGSEMLFWWLYRKPAIEGRPLTEFSEAITTIWMAIVEADVNVLTIAGRLITALVRKHLTTVTAQTIACSVI